MSKKEIKKDINESTHTVNESTHTVEELIKKLEKVKNKKLKAMILGVHEGKIDPNDGFAVYQDDCDGVVEFSDYVAICYTRLV